MNLKRILFLIKIQFFKIIFSLCTSICAYKVSNYLPRLIFLFYQHVEQISSGSFFKLFHQHGKDVMVLHNNPCAPNPGAECSVPQGGTLFQKQSGYFPQVSYVWGTELTNMEITLLFSRIQTFRVPPREPILKSVFFNLVQLPCCGQSRWIFYFYADLRKIWIFCFVKACFNK